MKVSEPIFSLILAIIALFNGTLAVETPPVYGCALNRTTGVCTFTNIRLTKTSIHYKPTVINVEEITFDNSTMEIFTSDTCNAFPHLKGIWAEMLEANVLNSDALENCPNLEYFTMTASNLENITDVNLFKNNPNLKIAAFSANQITSIDPDVFNHLSKLAILNLAGNKLKRFPIDTFSTMDSLLHLHIDKNEFEDLDELEVMKKFPKLVEIHLCSNDNIPPSRLDELVSFFTQKGVKTNYCGDPKT